MIIICVISYLITFSAFMIWSIAQTLIVKRLKELNGGVEHPLVSKNGIDVNIHNSEFSYFLKQIENEQDKKLHDYKILNKYGFRFGLSLFFISFILTLFS